MLTMSNTLYTRAVNASEVITRQCSGRVPPETLGALRAYLTQGREPSGFLLAVLENDLMRAACKADNSNLEGLGYLARAIEQNAPRVAHGKPETVDAWLNACESHYMGR